MERSNPMKEAPEDVRRRMLRRLDALREELAGEVGSLQTLLFEVDTRWAAICQEVIAGRTEQVQANRELSKANIEESLRTIRGWLPIAQAVIAPSNVEVAELRAMTQEAERFWLRIFDRWQSPEDLEDLVANATAPTREQLDALTRKYGFPHVWHAADDSPV